jgi:hypothetical protein
MNSLALLKQTYASGHLLRLSSTGRFMDCHRYPQAGCAGSVLIFDFRLCPSLWDSFYLLLFTQVKALISGQKTEVENVGCKIERALFRGPFNPEPQLPRRIIGPAHPHWRWSLGNKLILALVPPCTGECRLVRVIGVLIFANARACVAGRAGPLGHGADARLRTGDPPATLARDSKTSGRDSHQAVGRPVATGTIAGMT